MLGWRYHDNWEFPEGRSLLRRTFRFMLSGRYLDKCDGDEMNEILKPMTGMARREFREEKDLTGRVVSGYFLDEEVLP